jgi:DNA topoisomerase IA
MSDREGEAIAWHLLDELKPKNIPVHRMVFHEITRSAIEEAVANPREHRRRPRRGARERVASWTGSTATRSARCCGAR